MICLFVWLAVGYWYFREVLTYDATPFQTTVCALLGLVVGPALLLAAALYWAFEKVLKHAQ